VKYSFLNYTLFLFFRNGYEPAESHPVDENQDICDVPRLKASFRHDGRMFFAMFFFSRIRRRSVPPGSARTCGKYGRS